jgi:hypothetical protein
MCCRYEMMVQTCLYAANDFYSQVPSELLRSGSVYTFTLRLRNFFGFENTASFSARVANGALPSVVITAGSEAAALVTRAPVALSLFASAAVAVCPGRSASPSLDYVWSFLSVDSASGVLTSQSVDPRYFKLPALALNATQSYIAAVTVVDVSSGLNNSASLRVDVRRSGLTAVIDGGDRVIGLESSDGGTLPLMTLDASASIDQDSGTGRGLVYAWSCTVLDGSMGGTCGGSLASTLSVVTQNITDYGVGTFAFTVFLTKGDGGGDGRNATASVTIVTEIGAVPLVAVRAFDTTMTKVNPSERLVLVGTVGPVALAVDTSWSLLTGALVTSSNDDGLEVRCNCANIPTPQPPNLTDVTIAQDVAATSLIGEVDAGQTMAVYLVVQAGSMTPGAVYTFKLGAAYRDLIGGAEG